MGFTVAHVQHSSRIYKHTMRSSERTPQGVRFWSVASLTGAQYCSDDARLQLNLANDVIFGVGHVQRVARPCQALRPAKSCKTRRTTVARIPLLPGSGDMMKAQGLAIHAVDGVALPQCNVQVPGRIEGKCPGTIERCSVEGGTIWGWPPVPSAAEGVDEARGELYPSQTVITYVADEQKPAARVHGNAMRRTQLCVGWPQGVAQTDPVASVALNDFSDHHVACCRPPNKQSAELPIPPPTSGVAV